MKQYFFSGYFRIIACQFLLISVMVLSGCGGTQSFIDIPPDKAEEMIKSNIDNPHFILLDVRTPEEFNVEHFSGAINVDFKSTDFTDKVDKLNKEETYLVYCRSGVRSVKAMNLMKEKGFKFVYNLEGGLLKWHAENRPMNIK
jgi:rhodanese-related sulfurtransferase